MKPISLPLISSILIALSRTSALNNSTAELQPALRNETYILHYNHQLHKPILEPVRVITLDHSRTARVSEEVGGLHRRGLRFKPGFRLIKFKCPSSNKAFCDEAKKTVETAFKILEHTLKLRESVMVKVVFRDFPDAHIVNTITSQTSMIYDGKQRLCPTALFSQLHVPWFGEHRDYPKADIILEFNSGSDFFLPSDNRPIQSNEYDLLFLVLHEVIHGLGFRSAWHHHHSGISGLTPDIIVRQTFDGRYIFDGFVEAFFDEFLIDTTNDRPLGNRHISYHSDFFEEITRPKIGTVYRDPEELFSDFEMLPGYKERSKFMLDLATQRGSVAFRTRKGLEVIMDTSLRNAFDQWYSINHLDSTIYEKTSDFLMVHEPLPGVSLAELIDATGRNGPLGPLLSQILETLGYTIRKRHTETEFPLDSFSFWSNYVNNYQLTSSSPTCMSPMHSAIQKFKNKRPMRSALKRIKCAL